MLSHGRWRTIRFARWPTLALIVLLQGVAVLPEYVPHSRIVDAAPLQAAPRGKADLATSPATQTGLSGAAGQTFSLVVEVLPNAVEIDAAAVRLLFDPVALEVVDGGVTPGAQLDTEVLRRIDNAQGSAYFSATRLTGTRPSTTFTLVSFTFRLRVARTASLTVTVDRSTRPAADAVSDATSVLNEVRGTTITFSVASSTPASGTTGGGGSTGGGAGGTLAGNPQVAATAVPMATSTVAPVGTTRTVATSDGRAAGAAGQAGVVPLPANVQVGVQPVATPFAAFYAERQGLRVLGNTLAPPQLEGGVMVQYFEKGRMESYPDEPNPAWRFQYGLLVDELMAVGSPLPVGGETSTLTYAGLLTLAQPSLRLEPSAGFTGGVETLSDGSVFIPFSAALAPEPGHVVPPDFWLYINDETLFPGGWLQDIGLPVTDPLEAVVDKGAMLGRRIVVQAFQRAILTFDPLNPPDYHVERANVGTDYARAFPSKFGG